LVTVSLTSSQVDKLGERLKANAEAGESLSEEDRRALLEVRASYLPAYRAVIAGIREVTDTSPSGRPEKTVDSILGKLVREGTKLSRMQDIAGCRLVVQGRGQQDELVGLLLSRFPDHRIVDRREAPSHGYRAVHVVVREQGRPVEIQIRTMLQHSWATTVEAFSDQRGGDLKHGVEPPGLPGLLAVLTSASDDLADLEVQGIDAGAELTQLVPDQLQHLALLAYQSGLFRGTMSLAVKRTRKT
jgi:ppGpp synthetase/RelA/SpoT-type nucleotidyltranferase